MQTLHAYPTSIVSPTNDDLRKAWALVDEDPLSENAYTDLRPTFQEIRAHRNHLYYPWFVMYGNRLMAIQMLHDIETIRPPKVDALRRIGWTFMWIHPDARGRDAAFLRVEMMRQVIRRGYAVAGVDCPFAAVMADNEPANRVAIEQGFTRIGVYKNMLPRHGVLCDLVIYCWDPADKAIAWQAATKRSRGDAQAFPVT